MDAGERTGTFEHVGSNWHTERRVGIHLVRDHDLLVACFAQRAQNAVDQSHARDSRERFRLAISNRPAAGDRRTTDLHCPPHTWESRAGARATTGMPAAPASSRARVVGTERVAIHATPAAAALRAISPLTRALSTRPSMRRSVSMRNAAPS